MNASAFSELPDSRSYPSNINELNSPQWIHYLMLLSKFKNEEIDLQAFKSEWIGYLLGITSQNLNSFEKELLLKEHHKLLSGYIIFNKKGEQPDTFSLQNNLTQYTWKGSIYQGPQDMCMDMSFGTFLKGLFVFRDYVLTQDTTALTYLFATLYSDKSPLHERMEKLEDMPPNVALSAFYFFESVVNHIISKPISFQGEDLPLYQIFESDGIPNTGYTQGMETSLYDLASECSELENGVDLKDKNLFEVLRFIWFKTKDCRA